MPDIRKRLAALAATLLAVDTVTPTAFADSGVDVSNWQGCANSARAQAAKNSGTNFAFVKATESNGFTDRNAACSMAGFEAVGVRRGVYHFARPDLGNSPEAEADWFVSQTKEWIGKGVLPVLDWEPDGVSKTYVWWAKRWLDRVASAYGTKPLIYMSASVIRAADWTPVARADYGLWVAGYPRGYATDRLRNPRGAAVQREPLAVRRRMAVLQLRQRARHRQSHRRQLVLRRRRHLGKVCGRIRHHPHRHAARRHRQLRHASRRHRILGEGGHPGRIRQPAPTPAPGGRDLRRGNLREGAGHSQRLNRIRR